MDSQPVSTWDSIKRWCGFHPVNDEEVSSHFNAYFTAKVHRGYASGTVRHLGGVFYFDPWKTHAMVEVIFQDDDNGLCQRQLWPWHLVKDAKAFLKQLSVWIPDS
jgi:hypothetical protein